MRFIIDECTGPNVSQWLRDHQHDVFCVYEQARGMEDNEVIQKAFGENRILITNDKDFGEKIYIEKRPHCGVILLRLVDERSVMKIAVLEKLLNTYSDKISGNFIVVTERGVRFAKI